MLLRALKWCSYNLNSQCILYALRFTYNGLLRLIPELQLPSLDLLHVIYAKQVPERIKYFATLDKAIIGKAESIKNALGIEVITAPLQGPEEARQQK